MNFRQVEPSGLGITGLGNRPDNQKGSFCCTCPSLKGMCMETWCLISEAFWLLKNLFIERKVKDREKVIWLLYNSGVNSKLAQANWQPDGVPQHALLWWPLLFVFPIFFSTFWLTPNPSIHSFIHSLSCWQTAWQTAVKCLSLISTEDENACLFLVLDSFSTNLSRCLLLKLVSWALSRLNDRGVEMHIEMLVPTVENW